MLMLFHSSSVDQTWQPMSVQHLLASTTAGCLKLDLLGFTFVLQWWKSTEDYFLKMSFWFANEVLWIKLVCLDWVNSRGTCAFFCVQGLNMLLFLWNYISTYYDFLSPRLITHTTRECLKFTEIYPLKLILAQVWGNISLLCLTTFFFLIFLLPCLSPITAVLPPAYCWLYFFGSRRICHCEGDDESPLITPCHCTGSLRFVHQSCLQQWIKSSDTRCCELCKYEFIMETKLKPLRKVRRGFALCIHLKWRTIKAS